ncbi:MAG TPA: carboxypeptidase regulatory-like domain-containing protein [Vicinamibacterales bacterium]|nr:carboxypeptidase regulatory-like domain-containing protein [Vicinamibacterales bacterium]
MRGRLLGIVLAAVLAAGAPAAAQQGTSELRGKVADAQGGALPGVTVLLTNQANGTVRETISGADGSFIASGMIPGRYTVAAELTGFKKFERRDVVLEVGRTTSLDVPLEVGGIEETVSVTAESPIVDLTSKEIGGNITSETLVKLPSVNGNFVGFVGLLPGIVPSVSTESFGSDSISVNGQDPRNNNYMLDGGNNNDDVIGQRAGTQARTPIEAIQEFQVITGQYDAQYGRTSGAVVNAVTKSGTNQFRGVGFGFMQNADLTENHFFAKQQGTPKPDTQYQRWGGTFGGPIVRNKIHFFGSLERFSIDRPNAINIPARPEYNGTQQTMDRVWNTIIRGDHQVNNNNSYSVRWLREASPQRNQIIPTGAQAAAPAAAREESDVDQTVSASLNTVLSGTRVSTFRVTWTRENVTFANNCFNTKGRDLSQCPVTLAYQDYIDQQDNTAQARINDGIQLEETLAWFVPNKKGDHDLKFGLQYSYSAAFNTNQGNLNGTFSFGRSNAVFNPAIPSTYPDRFTIRVGGPNEFYQKAHYISWFAQDKWRLGNRVTLNLGMRYDYEALPLKTADDMFVGEDHPVDANNLAPRLGITYDFGNNSVIRAAAGRFFDKTHFEVIGGLYTGTPFATSFIVNFPTAAADNGPRNGQLPTDPFLVNGPVINRALLNQLYPGGQLLRNTGATWDNPDRRVPYTDEVSLGYERQLGAQLAGSVDFVHSRGRDLLMSFNHNPQVRSNPVVAQSTLVRTPTPQLTAAVQQLAQKYGTFAPFTTNVTTFVNEGELDYSALMLQLKKRFSNNYSAQVSYTLAKSRGNTSGNGAAGSNFQVGSDLRLELNEGPSDFDNRHNFTVSGTALIPRTGGLNLSWVARAISGRPFSLTNGNVDPDLNGIQAEPLPAGTYRGNGNNAYTVENYTPERNGAYGPGFFTLDMRFGYAFRLGGTRRLEVSADMFNMTNRTNFANPTGNQASAQFLLLTAYSTSYTPRKAQLGLRLEF